MYDLAAVDVGNSTLRVGYFKADKLEHTTSIRSKNVRQNVSLKKAKKIIVSSVVPRISKLIKQDYRDARFIQHSDLSFSGVGAYIGVDRLINAYAALYIYKRDVAVIDFGSAITLSVVQDRDFKGGIICPGFNTMLTSLYSKTAQLPLVSESKPPETVLNFETEKALEAGCFNVLKFGISSIISEAKKELKSKVLVVATGGNCLLFHDQIPEIDVVNPTLLLEGLRILA